MVQGAMDSVFTSAMFLSFFFSAMGGKCTRSASLSKAPLGQFGVTPAFLQFAACYTL